MSDESHEPLTPQQADQQQERILCDDCGRDITDNPYPSYNHHHHRICEECAENYCVCDDCDEIVPSDSAAYIRRPERTVCDSCLNNYDRCEHCEEYFDGEYTQHIYGGGSVCEHCYEDHGYYTCQQCGDAVHEDDAIIDEDDDEQHYCPDCYNMIRRRAESDARRAIREYGYKPDWNFHKAKEEHGIPRHKLLYMGVELEVENNSAGKYTNEETASTLKGMADLICKQDSSIRDGFEIVFHPQTYAYITGEGREATEACLALLRKRHFAGHNFGGMHVHINKSIFSQLHLYKFHRLFLQAQSLLTTISQRRKDKMERWASFYMPDKPGLNEDRHTALNYTDNTVEVRIFNSSIRADRYYKNIETVKALVDYTRICSLQELTAAGFLGYVLRMYSSYRNLAAFLMEKCPNQLDNESVIRMRKTLTRHAS